MRQGLTCITTLVIICEVAASVEAIEGTKLKGQRIHQQLVVHTFIFMA
jgi:hypothetical protein